MASHLFETEGEKLSRQFGIPVLSDPSSANFVVEKVRKLPYSFVKQHAVLPLDEREGKLILAISDPKNLDVIQEVRSLTSMEVEEVYCEKPRLDEAIERCYHQDEKEANAYFENLKNESEETHEESDEYDLLEQQSDAPVIRMLNMIILEAVQQGASDIHFEPQEEEMRIRYRIDGVLLERHASPREFQIQLITRIKVMAKLDIAEHRLPQDGRVKLKLGGRAIDFRVSSVPIAYGERIVMRILDKSNVIMGIDNIGMPEIALKKFKKIIKQNQGIILVTGPTGSGKTTTLYSAISEINSSEINVMTIEDPIEYKLPGMAQIGVNPKIKLSFAAGLRHILRQDPDVIMIGEIRDRETAEIAIQSSLTGHLVLSTLHTNDAPSAMTRLVDMGIEPYLLSSSVLAVLAQRLVRKICDHCKTPYEPTPEELEELGLDAKHLYRGEGCTACFGSGYKGRCGIYELMEVTAPIKQQILKSADATALRQVAHDHKLHSLKEEGAQLAIKGVTTLAEVLRVSR